MRKMLSLHIDHPVSGLLSSCALMVVLWLAAWLVSPESGVQAQSNCLLNCQASYTQCLSNPDPVPEGFCETEYDNCVEACLGSSINSSILVFKTELDNPA